MTTGNTTLLGLALPVEGELDGTWGDVVNDSLTSLVDSAVAGTTTLSADADVTLTDTVLAANQARQAVLLWTASNGASTRNVTAPARSKPYIVINAGTGSIVLRGAGPTTGVTIISGEKCLAAWNGSDFVKVSTSATTTGTVTAVSVVSANGLAGTSSGGATPALTLSTSITGVLKGNGTAISAAVAGTDYVTPTGTETLTNKTVSVDDNTVSGVAASSFVLSNGSGNIDGSAAQKAIPAGVVVGTTDTQTLTNKTISGADNTLTVDGTVPVGFRTIPQNSRSAAYTLVLADSGKHIFHPSADTTARTFTIPANSSVAYPIGTALTFINQNGAGVVTIAITTDTMRLSPAGTTGSRTLAANGSATCIKVTATEWLISGSGLT
jgi:hypothetical protein